MSIESETKNDAVEVDAGAEPTATGPDSDVTPTPKTVGEVPLAPDESAPAATPEVPAAAPPPPPTPAPAPVDETPAVPEADAQPTDEDDEPLYRPGMNWFVLRVASNKEDYVRDTLLRKVQIEGLESMVGRILVPTEKTKTLKGGKQRVTETKKYPGYVFVEMQLEADGRIPQDVFFLIKETTGVGDFVGATGRPTPLSATEVEQMLHDSRAPEESPDIKMDFVRGDIVRITSGAFESYEGTVDEFFPDKGIIRVLITIFGRQAPVDVEYWTLVRADE